MGGFLRRLLFGGGQRGAAARTPATPEPAISPARLDAALERLREQIPDPDAKQPDSSPATGQSDTDPPSQGQPDPAPGEDTPGKDR